MQAGLHKNKDISIAKARSKLYWVDLSHVLHAEKLQVDNQWPATTTLLDVAVNASSKMFPTLYSRHFKDGSMDPNILHATIV